MGRISDLWLDIQAEIGKGDLSFSQIAEKFSVPYSWVNEVATEMLEQEAESEFDN